MYIFWDLFLRFSCLLHICNGLFNGNILRNTNCLFVCNNPKRFIVQEMVTTVCLEFCKSLFQYLRVRSDPNSWLSRNCSQSTADGDLGVKSRSGFLIWLDIKLRTLGSAWAPETCSLVSLLSGFVAWASNLWKLLRFLAMNSQKMRQKLFVSFSPILNLFV